MLNIGNNVRLKSGGPVMVVESTLNSIVKCSWYDDSGTKIVADFNPDTLVPVKPEILID
jgi:uncharacterized protein YodC (DUF2158 family)